MAIDYRKLLRSYAKQKNVDPDIADRQVNQESGYDPNAISTAGAQGIAQIMPATAKGWGVDPTDPVASLHALVDADARYLKSYGGSWKDALTAYNAGPGKVGKSLPTETQNYISTILGGDGGSNPSITPAVSPLVTSSVATPSRADKAGKLLQIFSAMNGSQPSAQPGATPNYGPTAATTQRGYDLLSELRASSSDDGTGATTPGNDVSAPRSGAVQPQSYAPVKFEDKQVPDWAVDDLQYAREHGWKGKVTSGVRTRAEQQYLYDHPDAHPGTPAAAPGESNHEIENGGAFDASDAQQLWEILKNKPDRKATWAPSIGLKDEVHFSLTGH